MERYRRQIIRCSLLMAALVCPPLRLVFGTVAMPLRAWGWVLLLSLVPAAASEGEKLLHRDRRKSRKAVGV